MSSGERDEDVLTCGDTLAISDDYGDSSATLRCGKPFGHGGCHVETWLTPGGTRVSVRWRAEPARRRKRRLQ